METKGPRILLIDDERSMQDILGVTLGPAGYNIYPASTGEEGLRVFGSARPELILLDLFLPDMDGKDVLKRLREVTSTPIVVMSVRHEESEKIACLDAGADDYLTKPFTMGELLARLRAALRRAFGSGRIESFKTGNLKVDFDRREVFVGDDQIKLTATEYDLLKILVRHAGLIRTHYQLIHELWGTLNTKTRYICCVENFCATPDFCAISSPSQVSGTDFGPTPTGFKRERPVEIGDRRFRCKRT